MRALSVIVLSSLFLLSGAVRADDDHGIQPDAFEANQTGRATVPVPPPPPGIARSFQANHNLYGAGNAPAVAILAKGGSSVMLCASSDAPNKIQPAFIHTFPRVEENKQLQFKLAVEFPKDAKPGQFEREFQEMKRVLADPKKFPPPVVAKARLFHDKLLGSRIQSFNQSHSLFTLDDAAPIRDGAIRYGRTQRRLNRRIDFQEVSVRKVILPGTGGKEAFVVKIEHGVKEWDPIARVYVTRIEKTTYCR